MTTYELAREKDEHAILDLANYVFSQAAGPHDFAKLLPKVYGEGRHFARMHSVARVDGQIMAQVALLQQTMTVMDGTQLRVGYVGTVSVHPRARGEGYMKGCMALMEKEAVRQRMDIVMLGGQRQRYNYFGFERGGQRLTFSICKANIRHALKDVDASDITITGITPEDVPALMPLYETLALRAQRAPEDFCDILRSWKAAGYCVRKGGAIVGYAYAHANEIMELPLADEGLLYAVLKAWSQTMCDGNFGIIAYPHQLARVRALDAIAEGVRMTDDLMLRVFHWRRTLQALLSFKNAVTPLARGRAVVEIDGERLAISVREGGVTVKKTQDAPDAVFTALEAQRVMFGALSQYTQKPAALRDWFPLYFNHLVADQF